MSEATQAPSSTLAKLALISGEGVHVESLSWMELIKRKHGLLDGDSGKSVSADSDRSRSSGDAVAVQNV